MNMNASSQPPLQPAATLPFDNLAELRSRHSTLLQLQAHEIERFHPSPAEILGFLEAARNLGRSLSDFDQRETAQGIMDFWTSKLLGQVPMAAESLHSFYLDDFDESRAD